MLLRMYDVGDHHKEIRSYHEAHIVEDFEIPTTNNNNSMHKDNVWFLHLFFTISFQRWNESFSHSYFFHYPINRRSFLFLICLSFFSIRLFLYLYWIMFFFVCLIYLFMCVVIIVIIISIIMIYHVWWYWFFGFVLLLFVF